MHRSADDSGSWPGARHVAAPYIDSALAAQLEEYGGDWSTEPAVFGISEADLERAAHRDRALWMVTDLAAEDEQVAEEDKTVDPPDAFGAPGLPELLVSTLTAAGFPDHVVQQLCAVAPALTRGAATADVGRGSRGPTRATDDQLVDATDALVIVQRWTDAGLVDVIRDLAVSAGNELLARKGVADPQELSKTARETWRAQSKSAIANELQVLTGWGIQDCHDRVAFALAPRTVTDEAEQALSTGEVDWRQVRTAWQACRHLPPEVAAEVMRRTLGSGSRPDPQDDGDAEGGAPEHTARTSFGQFKDALERELTRVTGRDPKKAREERRAAVARRDTVAELEDNGTGSLTATGSTSSIVGAITRVDRVARAARAAGDERTLAQLRSDITLGLVLHGTLTPALRRAAGDANLQDGGAGDHDPQNDRRTDTRRTDTRRTDTRRTDTRRTNNGATNDGATNDTATNDTATNDGARAAYAWEREHDVIGGPGEIVARLLAAEPDVALEVVVPLDALVNPDSTALAEIPGYGYLTAEHARDLALQASVLHRLVIDPLDGRLVERTIKGYRPDRAMRDQIRAADRHCRAPACTIPAGKCQHDHETPYQHDEPSGGDGSTSETNLNLKHGRHHQFKTWGLWTSVMDALRNVTWTTLFGRCYQTRSYDYGVYTADFPSSSRTRTARRPGGSTGTPQGDSTGGSPDSTPGSVPDSTPGSVWEAMERLTRVGIDPTRDPDLRDRLIYSALAHRGPDERLAAPDDYADNDLAPRWGSRVDRDVPMRLRHRIGRTVRRNGPPADQPTPEEILHEHEKLFAEPEAPKGDPEPPPPF